MLRMLIVAGGFSLFLHAGTAHAASGLALSGAQLSNEEWRIVQQESHTFLDAWDTTERERTALKQQINRLNKRWSEQRVLCRGNVRRANRDDRFSVMQECWKTLLSLEIDERNMEGDLLKLTPPYSNNRETMLTKTMMLTDALHTIITAIDGSVYASEEDLTDAKKNLWQKYREPLQRATQQWQADLLSAWVTALLVHSPAPDTGDETDPLVACMLEKEVQLTHLESGNDAAITAAEIHVLSRHVLDCINITK